MRAAERVWLAAGIALLAAGCRGGEDALARGDSLWADSSYEEALAEYRLSHDERPGDDRVLARMAHAYAMVGRFERAHEAYRLLLARAPGYTDQAVFDYLHLAARARERSDRYGMAGAVEAALALRPGLQVAEMAAPLARYYARTGEIERARAYYDRALAYAPPDSVASLLFDFAQLQASQGNCADAIELFNAFRARESRGERADQARWNVGNCSLKLAREARQAGAPERALAYLQTTLDLGVPQNVIGQAWFERGEVLLELGRREEALDAYVRVLENARSAGNQLAERARQRIDAIRFGSGGDAPGHGSAPLLSPH
ncbi:MAG TPA: tetratricopeptide repeat protein [Longimicrobiales bacterium]|nr:tetratricopeptide repeat protein [Longimicrobiales bacterium]